MAVTYKKKMVLVGFMLVISSMGLFLVISTDDVKNNRVDFKIVDNGTGDYVVTYDDITGQPHVYKKTDMP